MAPSWSLSGLAAKLGLSTARPDSQPRAFPSEGFDAIGKDQLVEEETMPEYRSKHFYPARLGEVFNDRFQTVAKLGYGTSSTTWLARDLHTASCRTYNHLNKILPSHDPGANNIRKLLGAFEIIGPHGKHIVLALQGSQMSLRDLDTVFMRGRGFDEEFVKGAIRELLQALDFLHTEVQAVHTDVHPGNLLLGLNDDSLFRKMEENELGHPVPRKQLADRTIYLSRLMKPKVGPLLLSDFGEARLGPGPPRWRYHAYHAWDLLEGKTLFSARKEDESFSDAALGPPPTELLDRHRNRALEYWDENGKWGELVSIPAKTLEAAETKLDDKTKFLQFIRRTLTWDPKSRPMARELLQDPWLD
ncbi:kinase-like domain-containing protein [Lipomyces kononenkoae]|uniref:Kinase-like domain-containing protein n=1 Tax=Lipomyces kononenkoae TaxID=34357 RepID=A0ACC3T493_LIPKO